MTEEITNYYYWQYFLTLETDLITTSRYIEFTGADVNNNNKNNAETFSPELLRIFFAACAECENIAKILAKKKSEDEIGLGTLQKIIIMQNVEKKYIRLPNRTISCPAYSLYFTPWKTWNKTKDNTPQWWIDYNHVKHGRETNYHKANLSNTLNSVAALLCLLFEYYKETKKKGETFIDDVSSPPAPVKKKEETFIDVVSFPPALATKLFITDVSGLGFGNGKWCWSETFKKA